MLLAASGFMVILWVALIFSGFTSGYVHLLLVAALLVLVGRLFRKDNIS